MNDVGTIEQRLTILELQMRDLQMRIAKEEDLPHWLETMDGAFKDEPAFDEVIRIGREYRESFRPTEDCGQ